MRFFKLIVDDLELLGPLKNVLVDILLMLDNSDEDGVVRVVTQQEPETRLSWGKLVRLANADDKVFKFFDTNANLQEEWVRRLESRSYPIVNIQSLDGSREFSIFSQFVGVYAHQKYIYCKQNKRPYKAELFLNYACDMGLFDALDRKLEVLFLRFKQSKCPIMDYNKILKHANIYVNCFWSAGFFKVGILYLRIAEIFYHDSNMQNFSKALYAMLSSFYLGYHTYEHPYSQEIFEKFYPDNGWIDIFYKNNQQIKFNNFKDMLVYFKSLILNKFNVDCQLYLPEISKRTLRLSEELFEKFPVDSKIAVKVSS